MTLGLYDTRPRPAEPAHRANLLFFILSGAVAPEDAGGEQSHAEPMGANREGDFSRWFILTIGHSGANRLTGNLTRRPIKIKTAAFSVSRKHFSDYAFKFVPNNLAGKLIA